MAADVSSDAGSATNRPWQVEVNGINRVPESERTGRLADLFWIWFAANIGILAVVYGAVILSFGMNLWQGILVVLLGSASFFLVGVFTVAGRDGGAPMMTLSRAVFGIYGNVLPNAVSWISLVGWETVSVITGTLALMALFAMWVSGSTVLLAIVAMVIMVGLTIMAGLLGQATLVVIQTWASYIFGVLTFLVIALLIPGTNWSALLARPTGPWLTGFIPALTIVIAGTGLSWANAAADYSRYLPRRTRSGGVVWSTTLGGAIPLVVLMFTGMLLASHNTALATSANPIAVIKAALPSWAAIPYLITAAGGLVVEADLSLYSSGLNLLNMFVPWPRYRTVVVDAVIMVAGTVYVVLVARNFFGPFESFLVVLGIGLAAWAGVFLSHQLWRRAPGDAYSDRLLYARAGDGGKPTRTVNLPAVVSWIVGVVVGLLFTSSPFFNGPLATGVFASSSLEVVFAFVVAAGLYLATSRPAAAASAQGTAVPTEGG